MRNRLRFCNWIWRKKFVEIRNFRAQHKSLVEKSWSGQRDQHESIKPRQRTREIELVLVSADGVTPVSQWLMRSIRLLPVPSGCRRDLLTTVINPTATREDFSHTSPPRVLYFSYVSRYVEILNFWARRSFVKCYLCAGRCWMDGMGWW